MEQVRSVLKCAGQFDLAAETARLLRLLLATSLIPNGGLDAGPAPRLAVTRYVRSWLPLLRTADPRFRETLVPPADVAYVWLLHRLDVHAYAEDCIALQEDSIGDAAELQLLQPGQQSALEFSDGEDAAGRHSQQAWNTFSLQDISTAAAPQPYWPPQSGTAYERRAVHAGTSGWEGELSRRLLAQMPQGGWLLRSLAARGFDGSTAALHRAVDRYCRYLLLEQRHRSEELLPPLDVLLVWWAHKAHPATYLAHMDVLMGTAFDRLPALDCPQAARRTAYLYELEFGEPYDVLGPHPHAGLLPHQARSTSSSEPHCHPSHSLFSATTSATTPSSALADVCTPDGPSPRSSHAPPFSRTSISMAPVHTTASTQLPLYEDHDAHTYPQAASYAQLATHVAPLLRFFNHPQSMASSASTSAPRTPPLQAYGPSFHSRSRASPPSGIFIRSSTMPAEQAIQQRASPADRSCTGDLSGPPHLPGPSRSRSLAPARHSNNSNAWPSGRSSGPALPSTPPHDARHGGTWHVGSHVPGAASRNHDRASAPESLHYHGYALDNTSTPSPHGERATSPVATSPHVHRDDVADRSSPSRPTPSSSTLVLPLSTEALALLDAQRHSGPRRTSSRALPLAPSNTHVRALGHSYGNSHALAQSALTHGSSRQLQSHIGGFPGPRSGMLPSGPHRSSPRLSIGSIVTNTHGAPQPHMPNVATAVSYLVWLLESELQGAMDKAAGIREKLMALVRGRARREAARSKAVAKALAKAVAAKAAGFYTFCNLPMNSSHPFWDAMCPGTGLSGQHVGSDDWTRGFGGGAVSWAGEMLSGASFSSSRGSRCGEEGPPEQGPAGGQGRVAEPRVVFVLQPSARLREVVESEAWERAVAKAFAAHAGPQHAR